MAKNQKISIDLTEKDLQDLQRGKEFNWTYETEKGESIDVHLFNEEFEG